MKTAKGRIGHAKIEQESFFSTPKGLDLKPYKTIRLAVSGDVRLNRLETEIIDAADFQRLRSIKQLGTAYLVFPTALHTRFDHSLGAHAMSLTMIEAIRENKSNSDEERLISPEQEQLIRLYALLHDIGHLPFGHTLEDEFCIFPPHDRDAERIDRFMGSDSEIGRLLHHRLGTDLYGRLMNLMATGDRQHDALGEDLFIDDLVSNTACADLLDYLRRDCYFCNLSLDLDYRFLNYLYLQRIGKTRRAVVRLWKEDKPEPRRDILSELIRLLDDRYLLGERVYFHHAKLVSGAMVAGAVQRAISAGELKKQDLYAMGDETLLDRLARCKLESVRKLASSVSRRRLWKITYQHGRAAAEAEQAEIGEIDVIEELMRRWWKDAPARSEEEDRAAAMLGMGGGDLLVHCPSARMSMKLARTIVFWNGELKPLRDCTDDPLIGDKLSMILRSHESLWSIRTFVHPDFLDRQTEIDVACEYLFTAKREKRNDRRKTFLRRVIERIARQEGLGGNGTGGETEKRIDEALKELESAAPELQDREAIGRVVKKAFERTSGG